MLLPRLSWLVLIWLAACSSAQPQPSSSATVGGPCEGCEAIYEYGNRLLSPVDTLPDFAAAAERLLLRGTVWQRDGQTPAAGVILYIYHTNRAGVYPISADARGWARRHGYLRGWVKTDADGRYAFYTFRPGAYPGRSEPQHIHITVKEADKNEYYIDEYVFADDPLLTPAHRQRLEDRGGSGIVRLQAAGGLLIARRDIILGLNIPDYE